MTGKYELKQRAESQEQTRRRIARAAMELHQEVGPSATTVSEIARRAGVGRVTVYRHFADDSEILTACSGLYFEGHPPPDLGSWCSTEDPAARLRLGLSETYAYHRETEAMVSRILADIPDHPVVQPYYELWAQATEILLDPWDTRGRPEAPLRAAIALTLSFHTWQKLVRDQQLSDEEAVALAAGMVESV